MADYDGDPEKKPPECTDVVRCPNMKETGGGFDGERYRCAVCGGTYYLDYEEMR